MADARISSYQTLWDSKMIYGNISLKYIQLYSDFYFYKLQNNNMAALRIDNLASNFDSYKKWTIETVNVNLRIEIECVHGKPKMSVIRDLRAHYAYAKGWQI